MTARIQGPQANRLPRGDGRELLRSLLDLEEDAKPAPPIAAWKAWALAGWVLVAAGAYALSMLKSILQ